jgi:PPOX class probable F420-dependent enzyme
MTIPDSHRDLLGTSLATFATIDSSGRPQQTEVWFYEDGDSVALSLNDSRQKVKNLLKRPQCSVLILDPNNAQRYLEIRGDAEITPDEDLSFATKVGQKYGVDLRTFDTPGAKRVIVRVVPVKVNAVDMTS